MEVVWRVTLEVRGDQRLCDVPAGRFARVAAGIRPLEVCTPAGPPAAELISDAEALDQVIGAMGDSALARLIGCPEAAIQHGCNVGRIGVIRTPRYTSWWLIRFCMAEF